MSDDIDLIRDAADIAWKLRGEDPPTFSDLVPEWNYTDEEVARLWLIADEYRLAVEQMAKALGDEWVKRWRDRGRRGVDVDGFLITTKKGYVSEKCVDADGFWTVLMERPNLLPKYFNPNQARKASLPPEVRDTFFEKTTVVKPDAVRQASAIPVEVLNDR